MTKKNKINLNFYDKKGKKISTTFYDDKKSIKELNNFIEKHKEIMPTSDYKKAHKFYMKYKNIKFILVIDDTIDDFLEFQTMKNKITKAEIVRSAIRQLKEYKDYIGLVNSPKYNS